MWISKIKAMDILILMLHINFIVFKDYTNSFKCVIMECMCMKQFRFIKEIHVISYNKWGSHFCFVLLNLNVKCIPFSIMNFNTNRKHLIKPNTSY